MSLPPLLGLLSEAEYRDHYVRTLVHGPAIVMPDRARILFYESVFEHAFYGYSDKWSGNKDIFDLARAERMDWIRAVLMDPRSESYCEEISARKIHRLVLAPNNSYLVITELISPAKEKFITAFPCGASKASHVRHYPKWSK